MAVIYVSDQGSTLNLKENRIIIQKDGMVKNQFPIQQISQIVLLGNIQLSTQLIKRLLILGIEVVYLSKSGEYFGKLTTMTSSFNNIRKLQYEVFSKPEEKLKWAKIIVLAKLKNMENKLKRLSRDKEINMQLVIKKLQKYIEIIPSSTSIQKILGMEGICTRLYFSEIKKLLPPDMSFSRRMRPATDYTNALLNFSNYLLLKKVWASIERVGLDPYIGFLHSDRSAKPSLVLDMMEQFRTPISETIVWNVVNRKQFQPKHFDIHKNGIFLKEDDKKRFIQLFEEKMKEKITHPLTHTTMTYLEVIHFQSNLLSKSIRENIPYQGFVWRF